METLKFILSIWPIYLLLIIFAIGKLALDYFFKNNKKEHNLSGYEKKAHLFDTRAEFNLYKILLELFGEQYFIFPQINYSHLIKVKSAEWKESQAYRSRIDRKSADFVLCDKAQTLPLLVIELDGSAHNIQKKQDRDQFIDELLNQINLPILHLKNDNLDREFVKNEILKKLGNNETVISNQI